VQRYELDAKRFKFAQSVDKLAETARESVVEVDDEGIESALTACGKELIELRASFFRATHADIDKFSCDVPAPALTVFAQLAELHRRILAGIPDEHKRSAKHGSLANEESS
jgi:hypothetical protein